MEPKNKKDNKLTAVEASEVLGLKPAQKYVFLRTFNSKETFTKETWEKKVKENKII